MKRTFLLLLFGCMFFVPSHLMANLSTDSVGYERQDSEHIKEIMTAWDDQEGPWLYESMAAIVMKDAHPMRPATVSSTTFELIQKMDDGRVERIERVAETQLENERNTAGDNRDSYFWEEWLRLLRSADCEMSNSSSNGDPHLKSYDGEKFDFQTAGDYLLSSNKDESFLIQAQQVRHNENISVNGAAFLNVNGDSVEIFAQNKPVWMEDKSILINGRVIENENADIILKNGGVIRYQKGRHVVSWPTGEQLQFSERSFQNSKLLDLFIFVPGCNDFYDGLLGNNNGERTDDVVARDAETGEETTRADLKLSFDEIFGKDRRNANNRDRQIADLNFISRDFGNQFALDSTNSRFSNPMTDLSDEIRFPKENLTLADMEDDDLEEAINVAREAGVEDEDLFAAVYDYGFVGLEPIVDRPDYIKPEVREEHDAPQTNKENNQRRDENGKLIDQIRIGTGVFNGGTIRNVPRTQPRPTNRGGGNTGGGNRNNR